MTRAMIQCTVHLIIAVFVAVWSTALAVEPAEILSDAGLEARARTISANLRCLVCQNQSIDDSDADLARDLRVLVRERLQKGDTDEEVYDFVVARYGDFVLLNPPFKPSTFLLWGGPAALFVIGMIGVFVYFRRQSTIREEAVPLTVDEERQLASLLDKDSKG